MRLDRDAGEVRRSTALPSLPSIISRLVAAAGRVEEAAAGFEDDGRRGPAERRELRRDDAALGGAPGVERLGHRAEVLAQPAGLAGADAERAPRLLDVEAQQLRRARGGGDGPHGRGASGKPSLVVARIDRLGDLGLDFDAELVGEHHVARRCGRRARRAPAPAAAPARSGA